MNFIANKPRVFLKTFGCQMNEHDSQKMQTLLTNSGYEFTSDIEQAAVVILNSCSVRHGPENKIHSYLGRLKKLKKKNSELILAVGGCVAQQEKEQIFKKSPWVNLVFGPDSYFNLPQMLEKVKTTNHLLSTNFNKKLFKQNLDTLFPVKINAGKAYIAITQGCDNFCSFCIVPFTRGREVSRSLYTIVLEAKHLVMSGAKEITLVGQNVNSYTDGKHGFFELLSALASDVPGLQRIRFVSPHPKDWSSELSRLVATKSNICNQLHLPFQSGSSRILDLMRRDHNIESYKAKIDYLKQLVPDICLTTDIIVGFPTETEADFLATLNLVQEVGFTQLFAFKYSPRPGTKAAKLPDDVPLTEKVRRLAILNDWQSKFVKKKLKSYVDKEVVILVDRFYSLGQKTVSSGKTEGGITAKVVDQQLKLGELYKVKISKASVSSLEAINANLL